MYSVHGIPGRLRIPAGVLNGGPTRAVDAATAARSISGVESAELSPDTGSLVIYHDPSCIGSDVLLDVLRSRGCIGAVEQSKRRRRFNAAPSIVLLVVRALSVGLTRY
jgi:hypothetical protein